MAAIGILVGLIGAAIGIVVGAVGGLVGIALGLLGAALGLLPHLFPIVLITIGIIWLVKGSSPGRVAGAKLGHGDASRTQSPGSPR
ncbi:MAG: hypothetical protein ACLQVL_09725 [Terriglobia bacterium]